MLGEHSTSGFQPYLLGFLSQSLSISASGSLKIHNPPVSALQILRVYSWYTTFINKLFIFGYNTEEQTKDPMYYITTFPNSPKPGWNPGSQAF